MVLKRRDTLSHWNCMKESLVCNATLEDENKFVVDFEAVEGLLKQKDDCYVLPQFGNPVASEITYPFEIGDTEQADISAEENPEVPEDQAGAGEPKPSTSTGDLELLLN